MNESESQEMDRKPKILVVDDNIDAAESLAMLLELMGYPTRVAHAGEEALQTATEYVPDVIFLDIGLPGMNGYEVATELRSRGFTDTLLIALTGWGAEDDRRRAYSVGFDHHLTKPVEADRVEELLAQACADKEGDTNRDKVSAADARLVGTGATER